VAAVGPRRPDGRSRLPTWWARTGGLTTEESTNPCRSSTILSDVLAQQHDQGIQRPGAAAGEPYRVQVDLRHVRRPHHQVAHRQQDVAERRRLVPDEPALEP